MAFGRGSKGQHDGVVEPTAPGDEELVAATVLPGVGLPPWVAAEAAAAAAPVQVSPEAVAPAPAPVMAPVAAPVPEPAYAAAAPAYAAPAPAYAAPAPAYAAPALEPAYAAPAPAYVEPAAYAAPVAYAAPPLPAVDPLGLPVGQPAPVVAPAASAPAAPAVAFAAAAPAWAAMPPSWDTTAPVPVVGTGTVAVAPLDLTLLPPPVPGTASALAAPADGADDATAAGRRGSRRVLRWVLLLGVLAAVAAAVWFLLLPMLAPAEPEAGLDPRPAATALTRPATLAGLPLVADAAATPVVTAAIGVAPSAKGTGVAGGYGTGPVTLAVGAWGIGSPDPVMTITSQDRGVQRPHRRDHREGREHPAGRLDHAVRGHDRGRAAADRLAVHLERPRVHRPGVAGGRRAAAGRRRRHRGARDDHEVAPPRSTTKAAVACDGRLRRAAPGACVTGLPAHVPRPDLTRVARTRRAGDRPERRVLGAVSGSDAAGCRRPPEQGEAHHRHDGDVGPEVRARCHLRGHQGHGLVAVGERQHPGHLLEHGRQLVDRDDEPAQEQLRDRRRAA